MSVENGLKPLRHIGVVLAVAEHGSISAASSALGMGQSSLTKALHRAEEDFGKTLFERHSRGVTPTAFGRTLLEHAKQIRRQAQDAMNAVDAVAQEYGTVAVGAGASFLDALLPRAIARLITKRPTMRIQLHIDTVAKLLDELREGRLDLIFASEVPGIATAQDVSWTPLLTDEMDIVARLGHPLTQRSPVTIAELQEFGWVLGPPCDPQRTHLENVLRVHGVVPVEPTVETLSRAVTVQIVRQSDLLGLLPNSRSHPQATGLARVPCTEASWRRVAGICSRRNSTLSPAGLALTEELTATSRDYNEVLENYRER